MRVNRQRLTACLGALAELECNRFEEPEEDEGCVALEAPEPPGPCDPRELLEGRVREGGRCSSSYLLDLLQSVTLPEGGLGGPGGKGGKGGKGKPPPGADPSHAPARCTGRPGT